MDAAAMAIAVGSSGSGSSSSSASSSGYGSATTTPTTPGQYEGTTAATTTATIATVAPFYSEALTSLDAQHRQQQQQHHQLQQHQQQYQQQQQQPTHLYQQNYNYGMDAYNYSAYNYNVPSSHYEKLGKYSNSSSSSSNNNGSNINNNNNIHSNNSKPQAAATPFYAQPPSMPQTMPYEAYKYKMSQQQLLPAQQQHHNQTQQYSQLGMGLSMNLGMNMGMGLGLNMTAPTAQKQQQQQQHQQQQHSQQQQQPQHQQQLSPLEPSYAAIKPNNRYPNMYGSPGATVAVGTGPTVAGGAAGATVAAGGSNNHAYYDKYAMSLYPPNFATTAPLYSPPEETAYRKTSGNSGNCHWSLDYSNASNCHGTGPLGNAAPAAAAVYHHPSTVPNSALPPANNELYYKYDKYATPTAAYGGNPTYQTNLTQSYVGRGMWPTGNSPENSQSSARQSCCTQGFPPQQNCYYPRSNGYGTTYPAGNTASSLKLKHPPTDLYTNYELPPVQRGSYAYGQPGSGVGLGGLGGTSSTAPTANNSQRYVHPQLAMGLEASVSTAYYNDLNSLDNYGTNRTQPPSHPNPNYSTQNQPYGTQPYPNPQASASVSLEYQYRKRALSSSTASANNCYLTQQSNNLGTCLEAPVGSYVGYDLHASAAPQDLKSQAPSSHTSNIRDFLSSWNDDEEESPAISQSVAIVAPTPVATSPPPPVHQSNFMYETLEPSGPVATAVLDAQVSELNLPDIIIDHHEKSSVSLGNLAPNVGHVEDSFGSFDVEKELDELRLKKSNPAGESDALEEILRREPVVTEEALTPLSLPSPIPIPIAPELVTEAEASIEFDQGTSNSNESTFEKEYETFIHKIGSDTDTEMDAQDVSEYQERAKCSKPSKRKRGSTEERETESQLQLEEPVTTPLTTIKASVRDSRKLLARRRRNRIKMLKILEFESPKIKHRFYFRTLKLLRRRFAQFQVREQRMQSLRRQLTLKRESHLPLIKRRSVMQYAAQKEELQSIPSLRGPSESGRETVIKSVHAVRESLDCPSSTQVEDQRDLSEADHSSDSNHTQSMQSVELLGSFKGFDDVENTNLSPKAKLRVEEPELKVETEARVETKTIAPISPEQVKQSKQLEIQRWLNNSMEDHSLEKPQIQENQLEAVTSVICLSSSSASSSSSSSGSSSSSTDSSSSDDSDSSSSEDELQDIPDMDKEKDINNEASSSRKNSICSGDESDFNELAALQKELSQQSENELKSTVEASADSLDIETAKEKVSSKDIEQLKQILESDGDDELEGQSKPTVPKLSDLSKIALNSSLNIRKCSELDKKTRAPTKSQPREMSVEEALAEMYQQIGVASDPEESEAHKQLEEESAAAAGQDVLINLAEIFDNNSSDLYVVQCDLNENILGVVNGEQSELQQQQQLIELLTEPETVEGEDEVEVEVEGEAEPQFDGTTPLIHHEEIVSPENCKLLERQRQLLKYLHSKYVQSNISRFYHAQRVLKKYQRYRNRRFSSLSPHSPEFRVQVRPSKSV